MAAPCVRFVIGLPNPGRAVTAASIITAKRHASQDAPQRPPVGGTGAKLDTLKRGTGGRSSFNGVVATVFGGSGFLGGFIANRLGKIGTQLILPYRGELYSIERLKICGDLGQVLFHFFDLRDEISLAKAMKYSNVVINLIGKEIQTRNFPFDEVHVKGAQRIARIARESGVQKLIHFSALNVAENPKSVIKPGGSKFLASKWLGEQVVREEFPDAIIFRPSDMYEHTDRFLTYYASPFRRNWNWIPLWKRGKGVYKQPVFVSDVAQGVVNAIFEENNAGATYQAVGPRRYELGELVDYMFRIMRREPKDGYLRYDMRFDPFFLARVQINETYSKYPLLSWERLEREHTSDEVVYEFPTLEDLSVPLTLVEDRFPYELKYWRDQAYYDPDIAQFERVKPPPVVMD
ncbi:NADH dehydrogenase [ubiquinone] 1 alpha subcomplex subunit 9, mitochondrial-like [Ornithodoros turicata]|uniref:NADH dehydrogenase [ubiquinone] 1 alpha subcomplex subunit 9, mitochondrial-like n=1 Tax=Ornithodoros turicata TaxID=34597 RepID=UPI00313A0EFD